MEKHSQEQCNGKVPLDVFVCGGKKTGSACVDGAGCSPVGRDVGHSDGEDDQVRGPLRNNQRAAGP